jgi:hypothetical protein
MVKKYESVKNQAYTIRVQGESESNWSGAKPESIDPLLLSQSNKNTSGERWKIIQCQIDLLLQKGKTKEAMDALDVYVKETNEQYQCPLNTFQRDMQNGQHPYIGAHSFFGAFRDAAYYLYSEFFYSKKGDKTPSKKHFRKKVKIKPYHIFLHRNGKEIENIDFVDGQQPVGEVKGFSKYEVINHPFDFEFNLIINPKGLFFDLLSDQKKIIEILYQSTYHGIGARRAAGYGAWAIKKYEIKNSPSI